MMRQRRLRFGSARFYPTNCNGNLKAESQSNRTGLLVIGPTPPPCNGMSVATELVLRAISDQFSFIHLDTADRRGLSNMGELDAQNIVLAGYHGLKYLWFLLSKRPEVVYVPIAQNRLGFLRDCLFLIPARLLGKKVVIHLHGAYFDRFYKDASPAMQGLVRFALCGATRAIVLAQSLSDIFQGIIPKERVRVVPNGLEDKFGAGRNGVGKGDRRTVLFLSTLMKEKGTLDLLKAMPAVKRQIPDVRVVFAGEWYRSSDQERAEELVRELCLESQVEFVGSVAPPRKYEALRAADVFVLPSYNEGQPFALLEAMSASLPVVTTNVGGVMDTVVDGANGFLVQPGDITGIAERICEVLKDEVLRLRLGEASRQRFVEELSFERFAERMRGVFEELLEGGRAEYETEAV